MDFYEIARRWLIALLAEVLNVSLSVVEAILPGQPRWLAHIRTLEAQLRAAAQRGGAQGASGAPGPPPGQAERGERAEGERPRGGADPSDLQAMLESHAILHAALHDLEARGLSLDDALLKRMGEEWSTDAVLGFLRASDGQLRKFVAAALERAAEPLGLDFPSAQWDAATPAARPRAKPAAPRERSAS